MSLNRMEMTRRVFRDADTGREVWQVTDGEFECVPPYVHKCAFSSDDRHVVFMCNCDGSWQPYRLDLATGKTAQLAQVKDAGFLSVATAPATDEGYCWDDHGFVAVDLATLAARRAVDFGERLPTTDRAGRLATLNRAGTLALTTRHGVDGGPDVLLIAATDGSNRVSEVRLPRADIRAGHEQFCPGDDNVVSLCNGNDHQNDPAAEPARRVREWRIRRDTGELKPLAFMPPGFRATHCAWGPSGDRFYFHRKTVPNWLPTALCSVDREGGDFRVHYETSAHRLGHSAASPDEQWLVTDSQDDNRNLLMLVHLQQDRQIVLCWPNASIDSTRPDRRLPNLPPHKHRHTHPAFSNTGRYVVFGSDVSGRTQVYIVPVGDILGVRA